MARPSVIPTVKAALEDYLERIPVREDERVVIVKLTERGQALKQQARDVPPCILGASGLALDQVRKLQDDLQNLRSHLQDSL